MLLGTFAQKNDFLKCKEDYKVNRVMNRVGRSRVVEPPRRRSRVVHLAGIVTAAVFADARHIVEEITLLKLNQRRDAGRRGAADPE